MGLRAVVVALLVGSFFVCLPSCGKGDKPRPAEPSGGCSTSGTRECKVADDCGANSMHCTGGRCYANETGCPCTAPGECGSAAHCTRGTCHANAPGSPCSSAGECGPRAHCTAETCYANASGSPCGADTDCGPGSSCVSGTCN